MIVEIVGGPKDGQRLSIEGDVLVIPEISKSMIDWMEEVERDITTPMPTYRQVPYKVMEWHGRLCAVHPGVSKL